MSLLKYWRLKFCILYLPELTELVHSPTDVMKMHQKRLRLENVMRLEIKWGTIYHLYIRFNAKRFNKHSQTVLGKTTDEWVFISWQRTFFLSLPHTHPHTHTLHCLATHKHTHSIHHAVWPLTHLHTPCTTLFGHSHTYTLHTPRC